MSTPPPPRSPGAPGSPRSPRSPRARSPRSPRSGNRGDVLDRLRRGERPRVEPGLAGGLREWLEDGVAVVAGAIPPGAPPLVVDRWTLGRAGPAGGSPTGTEHPSPARIEAALVGALVRITVASGPPGDAFGDALAALEAEAGPGGIPEAVRAMSPSERRALRRSVAAHAAAVTAVFGAVPPAWLPRTGDRIRIPLAGGRIILAGTVDLLLGAPAGDRAGVCAVDVHPGPALPRHRDGLQFLGLLETLRSGAAPFRLAGFSTTTGELDVVDVSAELLAGTVTLALDAVIRSAGERTGRRREADGPGSVARGRRDPGRGEGPVPCTGVAA